MPVKGGCMRISLTLFMVLLCTGKVWAFDCDFFQDMRKSEVYVKYQIAGFRPGESHIYVTDCSEGYLIGMTNSGKTWIPVENIVLVEQDSKEQYVYNHQQY